MLPSVWDDNDQGIRDQNISLFSHFACFVHLAVSGYCPFHYVPCSVTYALRPKTRLINKEHRAVLLAHEHAFAYLRFSNTGTE